MASSLKVLGNDLPIIKKLSQGFTLVAHENAPAIATNSGNAIYSLSHHDEDVPASVRSEAVEAYIAHSWPTIRGQFIKAPKA